MKRRRRVWRRMDGAARTLILRALSPSLVSAVDSLGTAHDCWDALETQFSRTSLNSAISWFRSLVTPLSSISNLETHILAFQEAIGHIKSAKFNIPEQIAAGLFLSTLVDRDGEPTQWNAYTAKVSLTTTTTLNETIADVRNERRRILGNKSSSNSSDTAMSTVISLDTALTALESDARTRGASWCRFCRREGHWASECCSKGKSSERNRGKKTKKGKEKAHVAKDDDDDSSSADEHSHFVRSEHVLYTSVDQYIPRAQSDEFAFSTSKSRSIVIDSGTSSHVHSVRSDFVEVPSM